MYSIQEKIDWRVCYVSGWMVDKCEEECTSSLSMNYLWPGVPFSASSTPSDQW